MTKNEYVRVSETEKVYGQKNLLQAQLELLSLATGLGNYKKLRKEELTLKVSLKSKVGEALEILGNLDKLLPKTDYEKEHKEIKRKVVDASLQGEIDEITKKLRKLQEGV